MYQREQIAKTIRMNSFDEIAVELPAVNPADGRMPREYSMYIYYSLFSFLNGIQQWVIMRHITEYESEKLKYWFRLLLNHINSINTLWPTDAIWRHRSGSTLAQAMACCLMAPSHYLNQCWLLIIDVLWHSSESKFTARAQATILHNELQSYVLKLLSYLPGINELTLFTPRIKHHVCSHVKFSIID